jgi:hypothetical protein
MGNRRIIRNLNIGKTAKRKKRSSLPFDGREVSVTFDADGDKMTATLLDRVRPFLSDTDRFDHLAREAICADFKKSEDSTSRLYLSYHVDELDAAERKHYFGVSRPAAIGVDQLLAALRLVRIGLCPDGERSPNSARAVRGSSQSLTIRSVRPTICSSQNSAPADKVVELVIES